MSETHFKPIVSLTGSQYFTVQQLESFIASGNKFECDERLDKTANYSNLVCGETFDNSFKTCSPELCEYLNCIGCNNMNITEYDTKITEYVDRLDQYGQYVLTCDGKHGCKEVSLQLSWAKPVLDEEVHFYLIQQPNASEVTYTCRTEIDYNEDASNLICSLGGGADYEQVISCKDNLATCKARRCSQIDGSLSITGEIFNIIDTRGRIIRKCVYDIYSNTYKPHDDTPDPTYVYPQSNESNSTYYMIAQDAAMVSAKAGIYQCNEDDYTNGYINAICLDPDHNPANVPYDCTAKAGLCTEDLCQNLDKNICKEGIDLYTNVAGVLTLKTVCSVGSQSVCTSSNGYIMIMDAAIILIITFAMI